MPSSLLCLGLQSKFILLYLLSVEVLILTLLAPRSSMLSISSRQIPKTSSSNWKFVLSNQRITALLNNLICSLICLFCQSRRVIFQTVAYNTIFPVLVNIQYHMSDPTQCNTPRHWPIHTLSVVALALLFSFHQTR